KVGILANFGLIILEEIETKIYYDEALKTVVTPVFEVRDVNGNIIKKYNSWVEYNVDYQEGREEQTMIAGTEAKYLGTFARMEFCYYKDRFVPVFVNVNPAFFVKEAEHKGEITSFVENESEAYVSQANLYFTQGDYESAKNYYEKAKEAYEQEGDTKKASECREKISECEEKLRTETPTPTTTLPPTTAAPTTPSPTTSLPETLIPPTITPTTPPSTAIPPEIEKISDLELLRAIVLWTNDEISDLELLGIIRKWATG
ncbi:MAG: hypothetical protein DRN05_05830, partial [Thermoplasmata archaeon]